MEIGYWLIGNPIPPCIPPKRGKVKTRLTKLKKLKNSVFLIRSSNFNNPNPPLEGEIQRGPIRD